MKKAMLSMMVGLFASSVFADHNAIQLDKMILSLPKGWEVKITRPDHAVFQVQLLIPYV